MNMVSEALSNVWQWLSQHALGVGTAAAAVSLAIILYICIEEM